MRTSRRSRSLLVVLGTVAVLLVPAAVSADHSWGSYHWARTSNPFTVQLGDNVTSAWDAYLTTTSEDWTTPPVTDPPLPDVLDAPVVKGGTNARVCRPTSGRVEVCNFKYGNTGWLGVASIWLSGSHITAGTAKLNDTYFSSGTYNTPGWRNLVMCQEVGHTFGLGHVNENFDDPNTGSCMDYTRYPSGTETMPSNEHPNAHDYEQLETIYEHLDGTSTVGQSASSSGVGLSSAEWGRLVASTNTGRTQTFLRDFGNGVKVLTHVIWVLESDEHDH